MSSIYERQRTKFQGSFPSDQAVMTLAGNTIPLGIVQSMQVTFAQAISRIYDVGNGGQTGQVPVFYVGGRTTGSGVFNRVLGPASGSLCNFYRQMGDVCNPQDLVFRFAAGCGTNGTQSFNEQVVRPLRATPQGVTTAEYQLESVVLTQVGIRTDSQSMIVQDDAQFIFANMSCADTGVDPRIRAEVAPNE